MPTKIARLALAALCTGALAACAGPAEQQPQVPTLVTTSAGAPAPARPSTSAETGVQLRLDMSMAERKQIQQAYLDCLKTNGVADLRRMMANGPTEQDKAALAACEGKKPIEPPQLDPAKNPDYEEQHHKYQQCLDKAGINAETPEDTFDTVSKACETQAFAK
ncbi:hypothetical protein [Dactylosporangium sp. CA-092794]|uniref:hypothetical protein n=1 Tax=Dactylosporangium sp. CA-092794 TaxID=3239929 RepID=UPI003D91D1A8